MLRGSLIPRSQRVQDWQRTPAVGASATVEGAFAAQVTGAFSAALANPTVSAEMSDGAKLAVNLATVSISTFAAEGIDAIKDAAVGLAMSLATRAINEAMAAVGAAGAIPLLGTIASYAMLIAQALDPTSEGHAHGTGWRADEQRAFCQTDVAHGGWIEPVIATAADGPVPADFFINGVGKGTFKDGSPRYNYTTMGRLLIFATETVGEKGAAHAYGTKALSKERREIYRKLRMAICACRENGKPGTSPVHPITDGGALLWLVYVDMIRADVEAGRLPPKYVQYLCILEGAAMSGFQSSEAYFYADYAGDSWGHIARDVARLLYADRSWGDGHGIGAARKYAEEQIEKSGWFAPCFLWQNADDHPIFGFARDWTLRLSPFYSQFPKMEEQAKAALDKLLAENGEKPKIDLSKLNLRTLDRSKLPRIFLEQEGIPWFKIAAVIALAYMGWRVV